MTTPLETNPAGLESSGSAHEPAVRRDTGTLRATALFTSVLSSGLFAGFLTAVLILEVSLRSFPAPVYTQVRLVELVHLDDLASALLPAAILATATLVTVTMARRERNRWLALTALTLLLATFIISMLFSVPINTAQQSWSVLAPPCDWASVRDRWQIAHLVRTTSALTAFAALTAATATRRPLSPRKQRRRLDDEMSYPAGL